MNELCLVAPTLLELLELADDGVEVLLEPSEPVAGFEVLVELVWLVLLLLGDGTELGGLTFGVFGAGSGLGRFDDEFGVVGKREAFELCVFGVFGAGACATAAPAKGSAAIAAVRHVFIVVLRSNDWLRMTVDTCTFWQKRAYRRLGSKRRLQRLTWRSAAGSALDTEQGKAQD